MEDGGRGEAAARQDSASARGAHFPAAAEQRLGAAHLIGLAMRASSCVSGLQSSSFETRALATCLPFLEHQQNEGCTPQAATLCQRARTTSEAG